MMTDCGWDELKYLEYLKEKWGNKECVMLDVGYNRGHFTTEWLNRFPNSKAYGFEPIKELYENAKKDLDNRIRLFNFGLHNKDESKPIFFLQDGYDGMSSIHWRKDHFPKFQYKKEDVVLRTLDSVAELNALEHVDFIKIDTEGNELFVLQGAKEFIKSKNVSAIQIEYGGCYLDSKTTLRQVLVFLNNLGYTMLNKNMEVVTQLTMLENYDLQNYLAVKE